MIETKITITGVQAWYVVGVMIYLDGVEVGKSVAYCDDYRITPKSRAIVGDILELYKDGEVTVSFNLSKFKNVDVIRRDLDHMRIYPEGEN